MDIIIRRITFLTRELGDLARRGAMNLGLRDADERDVALEKRRVEKMLRREFGYSRTEAEKLVAEQFRWSR